MLPLLHQDPEGAHQDPRCVLACNHGGEFSLIKKALFFVFFFFRKGGRSLPQFFCSSFLFEGR
jgi:hypothetical protein